MTDRKIGALDEVLDNLGVFRSSHVDLVAACPSGFRRVAISQGGDYYLTLQGFAPDQVAYAHTHPDSEEWVVVLNGTGEAHLAETPIALYPGLMVGRAAAHPHGFLSHDPMCLLSIQLPRPATGSTTWDEAGETTAPIDCAVSGGTCRRCPRCGGHSLNMKARVFLCENCALEF